MRGCSNSSGLAVVCAARFRGRQGWKTRHVPIRSQPRLRPPADSYFFFPADFFAGAADFFVAGALFLPEESLFAAFAAGSGFLTSAGFPCLDGCAGTGGVAAGAGAASLPLRFFPVPAGAAGAAAAAAASALAPFPFFAGGGGGGGGGAYGFKNLRISVRDRSLPSSRR